MKDKAHLHGAWMPFVKADGPSSRRFLLGDEVFLLLRLPESADKGPVPDKVVSVTRFPGLDTVGGLDLSERCVLPAYTRSGKVDCQEGGMKSEILSLPIVSVGTRKIKDRTVQVVTLRKKTLQALQRKEAAASLEAERLRKTLAEKDERICDLEHVFSVVQSRLHEKERVCDELQLASNRLKSEMDRLKGGLAKAGVKSTADYSAEKPGFRRRVAGGLAGLNKK